MQKKMLLPIQSFSSNEELPPGGNIQYLNRFQASAERRHLRRYRLKERLLAVCEFYSGEIFDISRTGFSYRVSHVRNEEGNNLRRVKPIPSRSVDIFSPARCWHLFRDLEIKEVFDLYVDRFIQITAGFCNIEGGCGSLPA